MRYFDGVLSAEQHKAVHEFVSAPGWEYGWKSNPKRDIFSFWHKHYAGSRKHDDSEQYDCSEELKAAPVLYDFWQRLADGPLRGHTIVRCYANAYPYGADGTLHADSKARNSFTCVYYPHPQWSPNWGGETVFFNKEETDLIFSAYPKPNRLVVFPGTVPHVARGVSRACPVLRMTLMFKTEYGKGPSGLLAQAA